jgi:aspartyl-tRNA(Asn)/glutamyl-tRNA(Gln) amidotransferase subunit C
LLKSKIELFGCFSIIKVMISLEEVKKLAMLARIELTPKEEKELQKDLGAILDYVSKLKEVPTKETGTFKTLANVFREDEPVADESDVEKGGHVKVKHIL